MRTLYLGREQVHGYLRDFVRRLTRHEANAEPVPMVWIGIGTSGAILTQEIHRVDTDHMLPAEIEAITVSYDRRQEQVVHKEDEDSLRSLVAGSHVLVLDSSVHSGATMEGVREWLAAFGPSALMTYALVVKRGSRHVPNYFGVVIEDYDRAYFLLDVIPNNRVMPYGTIRRLREEDLNKPYVRTGHDDYDRLSWSDHWYDVRTDPRRRVYVYEHGGRLLGVLSFILREKTSVLIDLVARDGDAQRKGIGGHLVRWAITQGRCACCPVADLWSEPRAVEAYRRLGFDEAGGQTMELGNTTLHRMRMKLLYNLPATEMSALAPDLGSPLRHDFPQGDE